MFSGDVCSDRILFLSVLSVKQLGVEIQGAKMKLCWLYKLLVLLLVSEDRD